ncbi:hypothetical protein FQR65_LT07566 [Abscondita terminalis]|nr:hypothetical protein FQR65_LT07566 [Abscondita terminalis]
MAGHFEEELKERILLNVVHKRENNFGNRFREVGNDKRGTEENRYQLNQYYGRYLNNCNRIYDDYGSYNDNTWYDRNRRDEDRRKYQRYNRTYQAYKRLERRQYYEDSNAEERYNQPGNKYEEEITITFEESTEKEDEKKTKGEKKIVN